MSPSTPTAERIRGDYAARADRQRLARAEADRLAERLGYRPEELQVLPADANLGLSCGNPVEAAGLRPGEHVLDLGCGAGFDVFVAARRVGPSGRVTGVDLTPEMIDSARRNAHAWRRETGLDNVAFEEASIDRLPFEEATFDVVVSNCVLNLVPDIRQGYGEMFRVLRPGGRIAFTDLALARPLPRRLLRLASPWIGCTARLVTAGVLQRRLESAGFARVNVEPSPGNVAAMAGCRPGWRGRLLRLPGVRSLARLVIAVEVRGEKPADA